MKKIIITYILFFSSFLFGQLGKEYELEEIKFEGNETISSGELSGAISSQESPNWLFKFINSFTSFGSGPVYLDTLTLSSDTESLENYYFDQGFFEATVSYTFDIDSSENSASATFHINESDPSRLASFELAGIDTVDEEFIKFAREEYLDIDTTERYSKDVVETTAENVAAYFRDNGYMLAEYRPPLVVIDTMKNRADVEVSYNTGKRYKISEVRVDLSGEGDDLVKPSLIRKITDISPGNYYSFYETRRAQVRLYRTNLFNNVVVNGVIADTNGTWVPLNISADVGLMHEVAPEMFVNDEGNAVKLGVGVNFTKRNFLGDARLLNLSASTAAQNFPEFITSLSFQEPNVYGYGDLRLTLEQPYLFNEPINTRSETYITYQKREAEYQAKLIGTGFTFDFEMPQRSYVTSFIPAIRWERSEYIYEDDYLIEGLKDRFMDVEGMEEGPAEERATEYVLSHSNTTRATTVLLSTSIGAAKTNSLLFPTEGYTLALYLEDGNSLAYLAKQAGIAEFDQALYIKALFSSTYFPKIYSSEQDAFGIKFKFGNIFTYKGQSTQIPLNQRFYAGGNTSVRGWATRKLVPDFELGTVPLTDVGAILEGLSPGGFTIMETSVETRNRIMGALGGVLFVDAGNTWKGIDRITFDKFAVAGGFGIRYYSDFAPIRLDFGFKMINPEEGGPTVFNSSFLYELFDFMQLQLGIGEAF